ncbi:alpha/beta fold hydrolase [Peribacillus butanolivorans]|uniref:alpha/beta fold hydrolase n=1 Tax=Peribacillus butanolivorans TaxID=421767 RepID=UPI0036A4071A
MLEKKILKLKGNQNVSYIDEGNVSSPVVLLVHGFPESSLIWKEIVPKIVSLGYRAIAPDLPGFGHSDQFNIPSTWENYRQFVSNFLEKLKVDHVHLFCHDWGAIISLFWAGEHPEKILSLFVTDTIFAPDAEWHELAKFFRTPQIGEMTVEKLFSTRESFERLMKSGFPTITDELLDEFYSTFLTPEGRNIPLELYRSGDFKKIEKGKLLQIQKPATIVWGENDIACPLNFAHQIRDNEIPQATIHTIPNVGHFVPYEAAEEVNKVVELHFVKVQSKVKGGVSEWKM